MARHDALPPAARPNPRRRAPFRLTALALGIAGVGAGMWLFGTGDPPAIQNVASDLNQVGATGEMNDGLKSLINLSLISLPLILPLLWLAWSYNGLVAGEERVFAAWAQVESNYQRRRDLVPNLVRTVSRYLEHERGTLRDVTEQRSAALGALGTALHEVASAQQQAERHIEARPEAAATLEQLAAAQAAVDRSVGRFFALAENYPDLRAVDQFLELQAQLEGTENRINVARMEFNRRVEDFNGAIRRLPGSLLARLGDFRRKAYFQAAKDADQAAELEFESAPVTPR